jgi:hypothetical protein
MSTVNDWASDVSADITKPTDQYIERGFSDFEPLPAAFMNWALNELTNKALFPEQNPGWVVSGDIAASSGFIVENTPASLQVTVKGGVIEVGGFRDTYAETVLASDANDPTPTQDRYDLVIARNGAYEIVKGATTAFPAPSPAIPADAIGIAELYVPGGVTGFVPTPVNKDLRYKAPWRSTSIAAKPFRAHTTAVSSFSTTSLMDVTVQMVDGDGNNLTGTRSFKIEFFDLGGTGVPAGDTHALATCTVTTHGTSDITSGTPKDIQWGLTDSTGKAVVRIDMGVGSTKTLSVVVTPFNTTGGLSSGGLVSPPNYTRFAGGPTYFSKALTT